MMSGLFQIKMFKAYAQAAHVKDEPKTEFDFSSFPSLDQNNQKKSKQNETTDKKENVTLQQHSLKVKEESNNDIDQLYLDRASETEDFISSERVTATKSRNPFAKKFVSSRKFDKESKVKTNLSISEAGKISKRRLKKTKQKRALSEVKKLAVSLNEKDRNPIFTEAKIPDKTNIGLSCMYFADVPIYKRRIKFKFAVGKYSKYAIDSTPIKFVRYYRSKKLKIPASVINFNLKDQNLEITKPFGYSDELVLQQYSGELTKKLQDLNMAVTHNAKDLNSWLELCNLQSQIVVQNSHEKMKSNFFQENALNQQNSAEREIAVIERALQKLPGNYKLVMRRLSLLHLVKTNVEEVKQEWKTFLISCPNNLQAWSLFFDFLIYNFKSDVENVLQSFHTCFRYIIGMKVGTFVSHSLDVNDSLDEILLLIAQMLYFLLDTGHTEKCVCLIQTLLEFNLSNPRFWDQKSETNDCNDNESYQSDLSRFEIYFNSQIPKIGEQNYVSWRDFESRVFDRSETTNSSINLEIIEKFLKPELPVWKNWLALERYRIVNDTNPVRKSNNHVHESEIESEDLEDPERSLEFSFVKKYLIPFSASEKIKLVEQIYLFLVNISQNFNLEVLLSENYFKMTEDLFNLHTRHSVFDFDYPPNLSKLLMNLIELIANFAKTDARFLDVYLTSVKLQAKFSPNKRNGLKKALKLMLQLPGNANNLKIWKVLLLIEARNGSFHVVKKTVLSLSKSAQQSDFNSDTLTEFFLDCAISAGGIFDCETKDDLDILMWIFSKCGKLNRFREPDHLTFYFLLVQKFTDFVSGKSKELELDTLLEICSKIERRLQSECLTCLSFAIYKLFSLFLINLKTANSYLESIIMKTNSFYAYECLCRLNSKPFTVSKVRRIVDSQILLSNDTFQKRKLFYVAMHVEGLLKSYGFENNFRVKSIIERSLKCLKSSSYLWNRLLLIHLVSSRKQQDVHECFQNAVSSLPLNKNLFISFIPYFPEQLENCLKTMVEKGLRVRTPIEEVELFLNEICCK